MPTEFSGTCPTHGDFLYAVREQPDDEVEIRQAHCPVCHRQPSTVFTRDEPEE